MKARNIIILVLILLSTVLFWLLKKERITNQLLHTSKLELEDTLSVYKFLYYNSWRFDWVATTVVPMSTEITLKDTFNAEVFLAGFNGKPEYLKEAILLLGEGIDEKNNLVGKIDTLPAKNWLGQIQLIPQTIGKKHYYGELLIPTKENYESFYFYGEFDVIESKD